MNIPETSVPVPAGSTSNDDHSARRPPRARTRRPRKPAENATQSTGFADGASAPEAPRSQIKSNRPPQRRNPPNQARESSGQSEGASQKPRQARPPRKKGEDKKEGEKKEVESRTPGPSRRHKFQGKLTTTDNPGTSTDASEAAPLKPSERYRSNLPQGDDLTSTLIRSLSTPPYPDCPICFSSIHPAQPTWSCSPATPVVPSVDGQVHYCWTSFHTKCIKSWAAKSVKDVAEAWRARGEHDRVGDWRCPGCQAKREIVPSGYWYVASTRQHLRS